MLCKKLLVVDKDLEVDSNSVYLSMIDRGGLKWPTELVIHIVTVAFQELQVLISDEFEKKIRFAKYSICIGAAYMF